MTRADERLVLVRRPVFGARRTVTCIESSLSPSPGRRRVWASCSTPSWHSYTRWRMVPRGTTSVAWWR
ncbi:hypothetical protein LINGRAHAP2_LOCUS31308, partial [Linum grandiflorum]